jgi:hypothetical protein
MDEKWPRMATSTSLLGSFTCGKARHGTDSFTSPPKEGVLRIFCPKNPTASAGFEPANLGIKGQHEEAYIVLKNYSYSSNFFISSNHSNLRAEYHFKRFREIS